MRICIPSWFLSCLLGTGSHRFICCTLESRKTLQNKTSFNKTCRKTLSTKSNRPGNQFCWSPLSYWLTLSTNR